MGMNKMISNSVDKYYLTHRAVSEYDNALDGKRVWAMWDNGIFFILITKLLATEWGLK